MRRNEIHNLHSQLRAPSAPADIHLTFSNSAIQAAVLDRSRRPYATIVALEAAGLVGVLG
jgi:hypothetical protein